jgi:predicted nucleic acid-binding protein
MDTNVFISQLKQDDPYNSQAKVIINHLKRNEIQAETSVLTLLETASVASRLYSTRIGETNQNERKIFIMKTLKMLIDSRIKFIHITGDMPLTLGNLQTSMPSIFSESIMLSIQTTLRTLDLIHIAAARYAKHVNSELGAFVTGDTELVVKKNQLSKIIGMPILSPKEYVDGVGLKDNP